MAAPWLPLGAPKPPRPTRATSGLDSMPVSMRLHEIIILGGKTWLPVETLGGRARLAWRRERASPLHRIMVDFRAKRQRRRPEWHFAL
jgi:hypothetical protein